jgi:hypothetical protein
MRETILAAVRRIAEADDDIKGEGSRRGAIRCLEAGRFFTYRPLPDDFLPLARGECFSNAQEITLHRGCDYVEGFAGLKGDERAIHHAWNTMDGTGALDVTWRVPNRARENMWYFGISIPPRIVAEALVPLSDRDGEFSLL